jgi:pSer/pThr/pTyr-binding forkhead associated (FHA) protein
MLQTLRLSWEDPITGDQQEISGSFPITIGRDSQNTISLHSTTVSRHHARLDVEDEQIIIRDLGSTNGILINGQRVAQASLQDGELFQIGPFIFSVLLETAPVSISPPESIVIRWRKSDETTYQFVNAQLPATIGRSSENVLTLHSSKVSRHHATIDWQNGDWVLVDQHSTNGTLLNGEPCTRATIPLDNEVQIGEFILHAVLPEPHETADEEQTVIDQRPSSARITVIDRTAIYPAGMEEADEDRRKAEQTRVFPPPIFDQFQILPIAELKKLNYPLEETSYLTLGGGIGSFVWVDHLVICGVKPEDIIAIGVEPKPYTRLQRLALNSQISPEERLRSNSEACPDNIWGWPGYAVREMWQELKRGNLSQVARIGWQLFGEPDLAETYTPLSRDVFNAIERESARIGWDRIWRFGRVRAIRKTDDERYVVAYSQTRPGEGRVHKLILTPYLHLAVGYPAVRFLPDLQRYREETHDFKSVVNAYEAHPHVYEHLRLHGGTVLVRGRGIVASRILQRLQETRKINADISVIHLMQTPTFKGSRFGRAKRMTQHHWEYQPFTWPKATWGGDMRLLLAKVTEDERDQLLNDWGGTTTSSRRDWVAMIDSGVKEGWYKIRFGHVERVQRDETTGKLDTVIRGRTSLEGSTELLANFIIDATGFVAKLESNPLLHDLVKHYHLQRNVKDRLNVSVDFEIPEMQNGQGRVFASGATTLGSAFAPVDSFLGLQYAAFRSTDLLARVNAPGVRSLNFLRSIDQWFRWTRGVAP